LLAGSAPGPGYRGGTDRPAPDGETGPGDPSEALGARTYAHRGRGRSGPEFCRPALPGDHGHPKGPYEDASTQYPQPIGSGRGGKTEIAGTFQKEQGDPCLGKGGPGTTKGRFMKKKFHSNGKLLISGEYAILDGALGLAIPTSYGQSLGLVPTTSGMLDWKSYDRDGQPWFTAEFDIGSMAILSTSHQDRAKTLQGLLREAQ